MRRGDGGYSLQLPDMVSNDDRRFFGDEGFVLDPNGFNESKDDEADKGSRL